MNFADFSSLGCDHKYSRALYPQFCFLWVQLPRLNLSLKIVHGKFQK